MTAGGWRWRRWRLGFKLAVATFALVTLAFVVFVGALTSAVATVVEQRAGEEISEKTKLLVSLVEASDKDLRARAQTVAHMFERSIAGTYELRPTPVAGPLVDVRVAAEALAQGDLTIALHTEREDEVGELVLAINHIGQGLTRVVRTVRDSSESVASACTQIAHGNQDLSERTETQASALTETAASMDKLGATVVQNASGATQANTLVRGASEVAARGGARVGDVITTMKGIDEASHQIADIIGVIDGIALQTNILALNAAVEAARAGAAGQGFAVVAAEVRTLAVRSAEAAKAIKDLVGTNVARVQRGSTQVNQAGAIMEEVVSSIRRVTHLMGDINAASSEQTVNVTRVGTAVSQMDASTQQSAALVTQMAAAATTLRTQADDLVQSVAAFKLAEQPASTARAA